MKRPTSVLGLLVHLARARIAAAPRRAALALGSVAAGAALGAALHAMPCAHHCARSGIAAATHAAPSPATARAVLARLMLPRGHAHNDAVAATLRAGLLGRGIHPAEQNLAAMPALAWNGGGYGAAWIDTNGDGTIGLRFARTAADGARLGAPSRITHVPGAMDLLPELVWTGREYGVVFTRVRDDSFEVYFARLSAEGALQGAAVRLGGGGGALDLAARVAWTGSEYGVAWYRLESESGEMALRFARIAADGKRVGSERVVRRETLATGLPDLRWTGAEYAFGWNDLSPRSGTTSLVLLRISSEGAPGTALTISTLRGFAGATALALSERTVGALWEDGIMEQQPPALAFASANSSGVETRRTAITDRTSNVMNPALVGTGREFGAAWSDDRSDGYSVYFARIQRDGKLTGAPLRMNSAGAEALLPALAWSGSEYALAWTDVRNGDVAIYLGRLSAAGAKVGTDVRLSE